MMKRIYTVEMNKLMVGLAERAIPFSVSYLFNGIQVVCDEWDAICHDGSYGHRDGLLEIMGSIVKINYDTVEGGLTAQEILNRVDELRG